ncbi:MAG: hypothetical protein ACNA8W_11240, partial [Bradymonadaceae bacterium]
EERILGLIEVHLEVCHRAPVVLQFVYSVIFGPRQSRPEFDLICAHVEMQAQIVGIFEAAIESGELLPRPGFDALFLAEQLLGMINNHLMKVLKFNECGLKGQELDDCTSSELGDAARKRLVQFYSQGAGTLQTEVI